MIKNRLILTGIFIEMGVIEIEYELNKINVFTKSDEEPIIVPPIPLNRPTIPDFTITGRNINPIVFNL